jgi:hypothetical protein
MLAVEQGASLSEAARLRDGAEFRTASAPPETWSAITPAMGVLIGSIHSDFTEPFPWFLIDFVDEGGAQQKIEAKVWMLREDQPWHPIELMM